MATFIKAGFWEKLCKPCKGYKGWLNLDQFVESKIPAPAYKVFTALLSQSGGSDVLKRNADDPILTIGVTYWITAIDGNPDFTIVGAPNNEVGTYFIATGTTPNWGTGGAELKFNPGAPVATVLENTLGEVTFLYESPGQYKVVLENSFPLLKTYLYIQQIVPDEGFVITYYFDINSIQITTLNDVLSESNNKLYNTSFEIRVYN